MAGILISPRVEKKILGKRAAWKLKDGNPKFKDILRQRCRLRIKERRAHFVAQARGLDNPEVVEESLAGIVQEEYQRFIQELEKDFIPNQWDDEESFSGEYFTEEEEWLLKQFDALFQDDDALEKLLEEADSVVCPICLKGRLFELPAVYFLQCENCHSRVSGFSKLSELRLRISYCLDVHSASGCQSNINFFINCEEGVPYLYCLCSDCSYFDMVG